MCGKKFEVGKKYENGFSVEEYGVTLSYKTEYIVLGRTAKFVEIFDEDYKRTVKAKVREDSEGNESIYTTKIYPYRLSAVREVA